jgi:pimeloyl-ACP methyl ester carboxylesterase
MSPKRSFVLAKLRFGLLGTWNPWLASILPGYYFKWFLNTRVANICYLLGGNILFLSIEVLAKFGEHSNIVLSNGAKLEWTTCWFAVRTDISCAYFFPSDHLRSKIRLPVVVIKNKNNVTSSKLNPLLYLSGGPGAATGLEENRIENWSAWMEDNDWPYDLVLFDQRGTGLSQPKLDCYEVSVMVRHTLNKSLSAKPESRWWQQAVKKCHQRLSKAGIDLSNYTTSASSRDVGELMVALGGENWNLYGVSYGTRLALAVIRDYPEKLRSVILDSVYPPEVNELLETPFLYDNALSNVFKGCQADSSCQSAFPKLESSFFKLLDKLHQSPVEFTVSSESSHTNSPPALLPRGEGLALNVPATSPSLGEIKVRVDDDRLMDMIFYSLYSWDMSQTLPAAIEAAYQGQYQSLMPLVEDYVDWMFNDEFSYAVYLSVECQDRDTSSSRSEFLANVRQFPRIRKFVEHQWDEDLCRFWKIAKTGEDEGVRQPVVSEVPTLFLSGQYDPVTPPRWARRAASRFQQGYFVELPGVGHGTVDSDTCASDVVRVFLQSPWLKPTNDCLFWPSDSSFVTGNHRDNG